MELSELVTVKIVVPRGRPVTFEIRWKLESNGCCHTYIHTLYHSRPTDWPCDHKADSQIKLAQSCD